MIYTAPQALQHPARKLSGGEHGMDDPPDLRHGGGVDGVGLVGIHVDLQLDDRGEPGIALVGIPREASIIPWIGRRRPFVGSLGGQLTAPGDAGGGGVENGQGSSPDRERALFERDLRGRAGVLVRQKPSQLPDQVLAGVVRRRPHEHRRPGCDGGAAVGDVVRVGGRGGDSI